MKISENLRLAVTLLACTGMLSPVAAFGAAPADTSVRKVVSIQDTKLAADDALVGKVVDAQGNPVVNTTVKVDRNGQQSSQVVTNEKGEFSLTGLSGGVYRVSTNGTAANYRVWTALAAPPAATAGVLLVDHNAMVTRGQCASGGCANSAPVYGSPVQMGAPAYGGGEVIYGDGGCGDGGGGAVYGDGGGYVDGGYIDGGYAGGVPCDGGYATGGCGGGFLGFLSSPWVIGAGVAAAIAIPLALDDDDDDANGNGAGSGGGAS